MTTGSTPLASQAAGHSRRGFTLTEIAIVLGIIGLILGAIWVAAASVYSNLRVSKASTQLLSIVQATRTLYSTSATTGETGFVDETANYVSAGIFPSDMVSGTTALNPWNGATTVASQKIINDGDSFLIQMGGVPTAACVTMLTRNTGPGRDSGMTYANAAATAATASITTTSTFPITATAATTACTAKPVVQFVFKLKG